MSTRTALLGSALVLLVTAMAPTPAHATGRKGSLADLFKCIHNASRTLQIVHSSDNESSFQDPNTLEEKALGYSAIVRGLQRFGLVRCVPSLHLLAGDISIPGPFYQASSEVPGLASPGLADIAMFNANFVTANGMGNHEFDGGIDEFATMLDSAHFPFIAVNLDFSNVELQEDTPPIREGRDARRCARARGKVVKSCWLRAGLQRVGLIGRAPADFFNVIEDPDTTLPGLDFVGGRDPETNQPLVSAVDQVLEQVALLQERGIDRIVLLDHAQDFTADPLSASLLSGVDVIVAAGSTGFMASPVPNGPFSLLRPGDVAEADYPTVREDRDGNTVLVVNVEQLYRYVGNLIVEFDRRGRVRGFRENSSGPVATDEAGQQALADLVGAGAVAPRTEVVRTLQEIQATPTIQNAFAVVGATDFPLNGTRADVRSRETNLGRLAADSTVWFTQQEFPALGVDVALKNGGGIRDDIEGPAIIRLTIQAALAFDNDLTVLELTADQLIATLENSVSRVPAADGRFPQIAGMELEYDASEPGLEGLTSVLVPSRVKRLLVHRSDGTSDLVVDAGVAQGDLTRTFVLATNSFTATGGDGYAAFAIAPRLAATTTGEQQILEEYIQQALGGVVSIPDPPAGPRVIRLDVP